MRVALLCLTLATGVESFRHSLRMSGSRANPFQALAQKAKDALQKQQASTSFPTAPSSQASDPCLKVGPMAWKWPPLWPYPENSFSVKKPVESNSEEVPSTANRLWDALPSLPPEARESLKMHYQRFMDKSGATVLFLSDTDASWKQTLEGLEGVAHVTSWSFDSTTLSGGELPFEGDSFDYVVLPIGVVCYVTQPRMVFRQIWRVCRPGGTVFVSFYNKKSTELHLAECELETAQAAKDNTARIWQGLNDAQRMWVVGSMFQFSAGTGAGEGDAGWENLLGYELSGKIYNTIEPDEDLDLPPSKLSDDLGAVYVVQARKQSPPTAAEDPYRALMYELALENKINEPDRQLVSLRLAAELRRIATFEVPERDKIAQRWATSTVEVYEILNRMNAVFGPDMRALLAAMIVPHAEKNTPKAEKILLSLQQGLGLAKAGDFWDRVGAVTKKMPPEDRVYLLGTVAPYFGEPLAKDALSGLPQVLEESVNIVTSKLYPEDADMYYEIENPEAPTRGDCQVIAVDLVLSDYLGVDSGSTNARAPSEYLLRPSEREGFLEWLRALDSEVLKGWCSTRKAFKEEALLHHEEEVTARLGARSTTEESSTTEEAMLKGMADSGALEGAVGDSQS